jgi:two-component system response regulator
MRTIKILLVEDNAGDIRLTQEALNAGKVPHTMHVVKDGEQAMDFLFKNPPYTDVFTPDLILLDLNMPKRMDRKCYRK